MTFTWPQWRIARRRLIKFSGLFALIYISTCVYFWRTQVTKILAPLSVQPSHPERMGMPCETVRIPLPPDGQKTRASLYAFWVPANTPEAPVLLYLHGQDATRGKNLLHTESFHHCGFNVLVLDYRGFAESYPDETPCEATVYEDALAALNYLKRRFAPNEIFIFGHSLGGAVAIELATRKEAEDTAGLIVESTFTSILEMSAEQYYGFLKVLPIDILLTERFDSLKKIASIKSPILIIHGTNDLKVPHKMSQRLRAMAGRSAKLCLIDGAGHEDCGSIDKVKYRKHIHDFVAACRDRAELIRH